MKAHAASTIGITCLLAIAIWIAPAIAAEKSSSVEGFIRAYPALEQAKMKDAWLAKGNIYGEWTFTQPNPEDKTVVTPQADVVYGYCWFNLSGGPAVIHPAAHDKYQSISIFDMNHFIPAVIVSPSRPIVLRTPSQTAPIKRAHEVIVQTETGLAFLRMAIADNPEAVMDRARDTHTEGGNGTFEHVIPKFTQSTTRKGLKRIKKAIPRTQKEVNQVFTNGYQGSDPLLLAAGVMIGQLGIPAESVRYGVILNDSSGTPLSRNKTYTIKVPEGLQKPSGYWSITLYDTETRLLIANPQERYSVISYTAKPDEDGDFTVTLSPGGEGPNGIPTMGKPPYVIFRVYNPVGDIPQLHITTP